MHKPLSINIFVCALAGAFLSVLAAPSWDYMNCLHKGEYLPLPVGQCECAGSWKGVDCAVCTPGQACDAFSTCDNENIFKSPNSIGYSCTAGGANNFTNPAKAFSLNVFPDPQIPFLQNAEFTAYASLHGAPFLFNCSLRQCQLISVNGFPAVIKCSESSCLCGEFCSFEAAEVVASVSGDAALEIALGKQGAMLNGEFVFATSNFTISMDCEVAACLPSPSVCSKFTDCSSCTTESCYWCGSSNSCAPFAPGGCSDIIKSPKYCPGKG